MFGVSVSGSNIPLEVCHKKLDWTQSLFTFLFINQSRFLLSIGKKNTKQNACTTVQPD